MGISDYLRAKLAGLPGIESATSQLIGGRQIIRIGAIEAHVGSFASDNEIERAIRSALNMADPDTTEPIATPMPTVALVEEPKPDAPAPVVAPVAKPAPMITKNRTGASFFASLIREQQAALKEKFAKAGEDMLSLMGEMNELADAATQQVQHGKAEAADLRAALGMNSNGDDA